MIKWTIKFPYHELFQAGSKGGREDRYINQPYGLSCHMHSTSGGWRAILFAMPAIAFNLNELWVINTRNTAHTDNEIYAYQVTVAKFQRGFHIHARNDQVYISVIKLI